MKKYCVVVIILMLVSNHIFCMNEDVELKPIKSSNAIISDFVFISSQSQERRGDLSLVEEALNIRPDHFADYYHKLSQENKKVLINSSGQYNNQGKKTMCGVPALIKRLVDVYFPKEVINKIKYYADDEKSDVLNYCKQRLIASKGLLSVKQPTSDSAIYLGSSFTNGLCTLKQYDFPVTTWIRDKEHKTYATHFVTDDCEYRITDVQDNRCSLWVINHADPSLTFKKLIEHKDNIKGCCFSTTGTDVEAVVTYSESDMVFSKITTQESSYVESVHVESACDGVIVDVCFDPLLNQFLVGSYENYNNVVRRWLLDGQERKDSILYCGSLKRNGFLEQMAIYQEDDAYHLVILFSIGQQYSRQIAVLLENGSLLLQDGSYFHTQKKHNETLYPEIYACNNVIYMNDYRYPALSYKKKHNGSFFANLIDNFLSDAESNIHRVYSSDGAFLMSNSLKNTYGFNSIETIIKDAITHKPIISFDSLQSTLYKVGFTSDSTALIFINGSVNDKVLLLNDDDKQMLQEIDAKIGDNLGMAALLKYLSQKCIEEGVIKLRGQGSTYEMFLDWALESKTMLTLLKKCFPIQKI